MSREFVETGQTFTSAGDPYCPIERRRRGPAGLAASLAVLVAGTGFLAYAMLSAPRPVEGPAPRETALSAPETSVSEQRAARAGEAKIAAPDPETASPARPAPKVTISIKEALAESRAARAAVQTPGARTLAQGPSLKPVTINGPGNDEFDTTLAPRIKPEFDTASAPAPVMATRPVRIGTAFLASHEDAPPPVFFESDLQPAQQRRENAALAYAGDLDRQFGEMRIRITRGETFVDALERAGVAPQDRNEAAYAFGKHYNLRRLRPGQEFRLTLGWPNQTLFQLAAAQEEPQARLIGLEFRADPQTRVFVRRDAAGELVAEKSDVSLTTRVLSFSGRIRGSLYLSAKAVGAPDQIIADLADAFAYDVDFQREIFGGDEFEAIFEARYDDQGNLVSTGDILYARLNWRGRSKEKGYYRFDDDDDGRADFFDATGQSARRLLMKTPIDGARLSSGFGTRRHPILGYRRAHKGVDFAASRGTPIKAAGDGVIERANRYGSFGNYVRIRHANGYKTAYAHLNGFARSTRSGRRVKQGDIIGYVGTTGNSTGPHLHYEVHLNGAAVNPQRLKIAATGKTLAGADLDRFQIKRQLIDAMRLPPEEPASLFAKEDATADKSAL